MSYTSLSANYTARHYDCMWWDCDNRTCILSDIYKLKTGMCYVLHCGPTQPTP